MFQFVFDICCEMVQQNTGCFLFFRIQADGRLRFAGDSVAEVTAVDEAKVEIGLIFQQVQVAHQNLVGIAQPFVYFATGMSAVQAFHFDFEVLHVRIGVTRFVMEHRLRIFAACASHKDFTFVFAVEVQQDIACHESFFECSGSGQPGFFIYGEKAFDRSVLDIIGREDRQFGGYTDAIVGTQSRTVGAKPVSVDDCFDRIVVEIMCGSIILFADHVHVGLQNDCRQVFFAGSSRFRHQDVAYGIFFDCYFILLGE